MYYITKTEWQRMEREHPDCCGKSLKDPNIHTAFEGVMPGNDGKGGTTLLFEGQHFMIVDDKPECCEYCRWYFRGLGGTKECHLPKQKIYHGYCAESKPIQPKSEHDKAKVWCDI